MDRKLGRGLRPVLGGEAAGFPSNTKSSGPTPSSVPSDILIHAAIWPQHIWAENWGLVPLWGRGAGSPSNTIWQGPRPTCTSSFILIRPTVWPQCTNVTEKQRSDSTPNKSSAVAEVGDLGHNRAGVLCPFRGALETRLIQCGLRRCLLPYQVASSSIQPCGHNSVGCHSPRRNISANYCLVVEMHTVTARSDDDD